jgi:phosphoglycolate phosphatase-like HAD superfamily hydrolase
MHQIYEHDCYIFDCDGVILNSNILKLEAMRNTLIELDFPINEIDLCVDYFSSNFGKSRFHHVEHFLEKILMINKQNKQLIEDKILNSFSIQCKRLYLTAELTPFFLEFILLLKGAKYIASGSEQKELRGVFEARGLSKYFNGIYGSPTKKSDLIASIIKQSQSKKIMMFGDAVSDFEASRDNHIKFICYLPFSNVKEKMLKLSKENNFDVLSEWPIKLDKKYQGN